MNILHYVVRRIAPYFLFYMAVQSLVRIVLTIYEGNDLTGSAMAMVTAFVVGAAFDVAVFAYMAIPLTLVALCIPQRWQGEKRDKIISNIVFFIFSYVLFFTAVGEYLFWDEFQTRYNFIAVDYLVYTNEVIGNIRESYPVEWIFPAIGLLAAAAAFTFYKTFDFFRMRFVPWNVRALSVLSVIVLSVISFFVMNSAYADVSTNRFVNHVGRNGVFELFSAFRNNELDYDHFFLTRPKEEVAAFARDKIARGGVAENPLERYVRNEGKKKYNLVVVTVESLGANFLTEFGRTDNVTPNLDWLTKESLFFSNLYATGTRTVYGLSSLTLSLPPIPGNSIVRRPDNGDLFSIGHVMETQNYESKFIYGGYGYFDNMNDFFADNGYKIVDRNVLSEEEINFANIWGVADDDLFRRVIKENDEAFAQGKSFFNMVMTTSNHRPYTFPPGKIDMPNGSRSAGVKFSDFAIGEFLSESKKKPWFKNTIFVIVADHTAGSGGKTELNPQMYHIPMWIYAPGIVESGRVDKMASQIDVIPTVLGLMGVDYTSRFYGVDLMKESPGRAFISNYQSLGYLTEKGLVILKVGKKAEFHTKGPDGEYVVDKQVPPDLLNDAIGYYQSASYWKDWSRKN